MKMIVCLLFAASFASASLAQDACGDKKEEQKIKFTGGPIAEMNASGFICSGIAGGRSEMEIGAGMGGFLDMGIAGWFLVQCEMVFQYKTSRLSCDTRVSRWSVDLDNWEKVLRVECRGLSAFGICRMLENEGYSCRELEYLPGEMARLGALAKALSAALLLAALAPASASVLWE